MESIVFRYRTYKPHLKSLDAPLLAERALNNIQFESLTKQNLEKKYEINQEKKQTKDNFKLKQDEPQKNLI